jgi:hypothetical protein
MLIEKKRQILLELFQLTKTSFSDSSVDFILGLIDADEWGVALETIYDLLGDNEVLISRHAYNLIQKLATMVEMNTRDWHLLEYQIQQ